MTINIKQVRKIWLTTVAIEVLFFVAIGLAWLFWLSDGMDVWWMLLAILPMHFAMVARRKKWCRCPHCNESLLGLDGDSIFSKKCEHCGEAF
jgi:hypothetical protein